MDACCLSFSNLLNLPLVFPRISTLFLPPLIPSEFDPCQLKQRVQDPSQWLMLPRGEGSRLPQSHTERQHLQNHAIKPPATTMPLKRLPCRFYAQGRCARGDSCTFIHGGSRPDQHQPSQNRDLDRYTDHRPRFRLGEPLGAGQLGFTNLAPPGDRVPDPTAIASRTSDGLLKPTKYYSSHRGASAALERILIDNGRHLGSVTAAEQLLIVLNSVNAANDQWVGVNNATSVTVRVDEKDALLSVVAKVGGRGESREYS